MTKQKILKKLALTILILGIPVTILSVSPTKKHNGVLVTNNNIKIESENINFKNNVLAEKTAIDPRLVFSDTNINAYINNNNVELKSGPYQSDSTLLTLNIYEPITIIGINDYEYSKILYNGNEYFIENKNYSKDINLIYNNIEPSEQYIRENNVELKSIPDNNSETKLILNKFDPVTLIAINPNNNFSKIKYNENEYFVSNENLTEDKSSIFNDINKTLYTNTNVKLRKAPGAEEYYEKININTEVNIIGENSEYYMISYNANIGYIAKKYLSTTKISTGGQNIKNGDKVVAQFTAYCSTDPGCTNYDAMGNYLNPSNNTCAAPTCIPFGTKIQILGTGTYLDGQIFTVTDRGGAIKVKSDGTYIFDILMSNENECIQFGRKNGYAIIVE